jgi:hypothetical protein
VRHPDGQLTHRDGATTRTRVKFRAVCLAIGDRGEPISEECAWRDTQAETGPDVLQLQQLRAWDRPDTVFQIVEQCTITTEIRHVAYFPRPRIKDA